MSESTSKCGLCEKPIDMDYEEESREDESGVYHEDCFLEEQAKEMAYHLGTWKQHRAQQEEKALYADAYEWGDPKNPAYVEWLIEQADAERG